MNYYGKAKESLQKIIDAFQSGNISAPLATIFLDNIHNTGKPVQTWSYTNQLICALAGCHDPRGLRQWNKVGRKVRKGEKAAAFILVPLITKQEDPNDPDTQISRTTGFKTVPVFDLSQTDGADLAKPNSPATQFIQGLPLIEVARSWDISIFTYSGSASRPEGMYTYRIKSDSAATIGLGVANAQTFLHELVHAADHKLGNLSKGENKLLRNELVAELGAVTLAHMLGLDCVDTGGAWRYIEAYATGANVSPISACMQVFNDTSAAIERIVHEYKQVTENSKLVVP